MAWEEELEAKVGLPTHLLPDRVPSISGSEPTAAGMVTQSPGAEERSGVQGGGDSPSSSASQYPHQHQDP